MDIKEVLQELGYSPADYGNFYRMPASYRGGDGKISLGVHKETGHWKDFGTGEGGNFAELLVKHFKTNHAMVEAWLKEHNCDITKLKEKTEVQEKLKMPKIYPKDILLRLLPDYRYWKGRGISEETQKTFGLGLATNGKLRNRVVAHVYNSQMEIIGFDGRWVFPLEGEYSGIPKYLKIGRKTDFLFPWTLSEIPILESGEVVLVEGVGDILALWESGVKNILCLFGIELSGKLLSYLVKLNPNKIYVCPNNEPDNNNIGNDAAVEISKKLCKYFDPSRVEIKLPPKKDFGEMTSDEIRAFWGRN